MPNSQRDLDWVNDLIQILETALKNDGKITIIMPNGEKITEIVTKALVDLIVKNQSALLRIGINTFKDFLKIKSEGKNLEALQFIYDKMTVDELVEMAKLNAIEMERKAVEIQETRKFWLDLTMQVGMKLAFGILGVLLA